VAPNEYESLLGTGDSNSDQLPSLEWVVSRSNSDSCTETCASFDGRTCATGSWPVNASAVEDIISASLNFTTGNSSDLMCSSVTASTDRYQTGLPGYDLASGDCQYNAWGNYSCSSTAATTDANLRRVCPCSIPVLNYSYPSFRCAPYQATKHTHSAEKHYAECKFYACAGITLSASACDSSVGGKGDTYFRLFNSSGDQVSYDDDSCALSEVVYTTTGDCQIYSLHQGCYGSKKSCGATNGVLVTVTSAATSAPSPSPTTAAPTISTSIPDTLGVEWTYSVWSNVSCSTTCALYGGRRCVDNWPWPGDSEEMNATLSDVVNGAVFFL
jgi:hypothetical protein